MRYSTSILALVAPLLVSAAPARLSKRAAADVLVFKFADVLEQLETAFYTQALAKFTESDFTAAGFSSPQIAIQQFTNIQADESTHSTVLQAALKSFGETPITSCKFDFTPALGDVATMTATARVVEQVGVGAYLGGATLLTDPVLLTAAGSILTIEARHQTILNLLSSGSSIPGAFDVPLTPSEVLALASPFISGCDVGIPANPVLSVTNTGTVASGTALKFSATPINGTITEDKLFCQMIVGGASSSISLPFSQCVVPDGINGPVAIWITSDSQPLINNVRDRATTQLVAGPTIAFIDSKPDMLGQLARSAATPAGAASASISTSTISPDAAQSIIQSAATGTSTAAAAAATDASGQPPAAVAPAAGPIFKTGANGDNSITVNGWSSAPAPAS